MEKIFNPIGRFQFFIAVIILYFAYNLFLKFGFFFDNNGAILGIMFLIFPFIFFILISKRFFDIFENLKKSLIVSLVLILVSVSLILFLMFFSGFDFYLAVTGLPILGNSKIDVSLLLFINSLYLKLLFLFLILKNGKSSKFINLDKNKILPRALLTAGIFILYYILTSPYINSTTAFVDYKMYPSLEMQDRLLVKKVLKSTKLNRNDIVCIGKNVLFPYRIIGLPNETVILKGKEIYINGKQLNNNFAFYGKNLMPINFYENINLDDNSYFIMGDNRYYDETGKIYKKNKKGVGVWKDIKIPSYDDSGIVRAFSTVQKENIIGKVVGIHYINDFTDNKKVKSSYKFSNNGSDFGFKQKTLSSKLFGREE